MNSASRLTDRDASQSHGDGDASERGVDPAMNPGHGLGRDRLSRLAGCCASSGVGAPRKSTRALGGPA